MTLRKLYHTAATRLSPARDLLRLLRWIALAVPVALVTGAAGAFFLWGLEEVTKLQWRHPELLWGLPLGGVLVGLFYHRAGKGVEKGSNLLIDEIHQPGGGVPARMAPMVLLGTWITHLFGGSAGREGTAVQMGGGLAGLLARWFRVSSGDRRVMLICGIAAGFGAVFGTPLTGAVFALEVLVIGRVEYRALLPALAAGIFGDAVCTALGGHHVLYHLNVSTSSGARAPFHAALLLKVALTGIACGLAARFFSTLTHFVQRGTARAIPFPPLRPALGGAVVIALVYALGTRDYLGLGVHPPPGGHVSILTAFENGGANPLSWFWKTVFTAVTLGCGFKGGEVTPLFFIGATLGCVLGPAMGEPSALFAAVGFIAIFAGAANTPLACTLMGIELFGAHYSAYFAVGCFTAYYCSGDTGIYKSQRPGVPKNAAWPDQAP